VKLAFMDSGYAGDRVADATTIRVEIVRKPKDQVGFALHARRWVVERFFAWIGRNRRLAKGDRRSAGGHFEVTIASADAFLYAASVIILLRRIARSAWDSRQTLSQVNPYRFTRPAQGRTRGNRRRGTQPMSYARQNGTRRAPTDAARPGRGRPISALAAPRR
jgi:transposase